MINLPNKRTCYLCGKEISAEAEPWELYGQEICEFCVYQYCVQCELCGELALASDTDMLLVEETPEESSYYHRNCLDKKRLLENLREKLKRKA